MWICKITISLLCSTQPVNFWHVRQTRVVVRADQVNDPILTQFSWPDQDFIVKTKHKMRLEHSQIDVYQLQFPSYIKSKHSANDTVYGEYFKPLGGARGPAVLVLDILDGAELVSRGEAVWLAAHGIPAMTLSMPYYGKRRPPGEKIRMISLDINQTLDNVRQAVFDARRGLAWLSQQPEVDPQRIGIVGTSLGSFLGALCTAAEPRVSFACLLLGGGNLVESYYEHPQAAFMLQGLRLIGISKSILQRQIAAVDPITYANHLKEKSILYVGASQDEIVPPKALLSLWKATGDQRIVWLNSTHVGAAAYAFRAMDEVLKHINHR